MDLDTRALHLNETGERGQAFSFSTEFGDLLGFDPVVLNVLPATSVADFFRY